MWISGSCAARSDSNKSSHGRSRPEQESLSRCKCKKSHVLTSRPSPLISTSGFYIPSSLLSQHFARYIVRVYIIKASCPPPPTEALLWWGWCHKIPVNMKAVNIATLPWLYSCHRLVVFRLRSGVPQLLKLDILFIILNSVKLHCTLLFLRKINRLFSWFDWVYTF